MTVGAEGDKGQVKDRSVHGGKALNKDAPAEHELHVWWGRNRIVQMFYFVKEGIFATKEEQIGVMVLIQG